MGTAAVQNYVISQGETLIGNFSVQIPGIPMSDSGTTTLGSAVISGLSGTYTDGMSITGPGIPANTVIAVGGGGANTITLTNPATASGSSITFVIGAWLPVSLGGVSLLFSAKTLNTLPDSDSIIQGVYEFNWSETAAPTIGQGTLVIPDTVTQQMQAASWQYLIRAVGASIIPASVNIQTGVITITQPVSNRII